MALSDFLDHIRIQTPRGPEPLSPYQKELAIELDKLSKSGKSFIMTKPRRYRDAGLREAIEWLRNHGTTPERSVATVSPSE